MIPGTLEIIPVFVSGEMDEDRSISSIIIKSKAEIRDGDVVIVSQKIVSKREGRTVRLSSVIPSQLSIGIASAYGKDPRLVELILSESRRIVRMKDGIIIVETHGNFVCANAGVDESNVAGGYATLLPVNPDESASGMRREILDKTGKQVAVIISDTFGRPFRLGQTDFAIGVSGMDPILDYTGIQDAFGRVLRVTATAIADEMCGAAELVSGKISRAPIAIVRNYKYSPGTGNAGDLLRPRDGDLFR